LRLGERRESCSGWPPKIDEMCAVGANFEQIILRDTHVRMIIAEENAIEQGMFLE
jgi:hypothetical protein